jgi:hypothetical protein
MYDRAIRGTGTCEEASGVPGETRRTGFPCAEYIAEEQVAALP